MRSRPFPGSSDSQRGLGPLQSGRGSWQVTNRSFPFSIVGDAGVNILPSGLHLVHFRLLCLIPLGWASCGCAGMAGIQGTPSYDLLQMSKMLIVTPDLRKAVGFGRDWKPGHIRIRSPYEEQRKVVCVCSWGGAGIQELD